MEFLHTLADRPITSNDEAFHALILFLDGTDPGRRLSRPCRCAARRGSCFRASSPRPLTMRSSGERWRWRWSGHFDQRRADPTGYWNHTALCGARAAIPGYLPPSSPNQTFKGSEFLSILSKAEEYQKNRGIPSVPTAPPSQG